MKIQNTKTIVALAAAFVTSIASGSFSTDHVVAVVQADDPAPSEFRRPPRGEFPPELAAKLSADQITKLKAAMSMDEKIALLKSWNIDLPTPPAGGPRGRGPGPGPDVSSALKTLFDKTRTATSDVEREAARQALRDYYKTSTDDGEREAIRGYFAHRPSQTSNSSASSSDGSSSGVSQ